MHVRYGFHLSISGSVANAAHEAMSNGYGTFQIFPSSPRSWGIREIGMKEATIFRSYVKEHDLLPFVHIPYLCNLASPRKEIKEKSAAMLVKSMHSCLELGVSSIVIHMGSHLGKGKEVGIENLVEGVGAALDSVGSVSILLENSSGYTNSIGSSIDEISTVISRIGSERVGICFDTCHAFAYGYDLASPAGLRELENEFNEQIGKERLRLIHLNDSKYQIGSKLDRHWHIGKGYIGLEGIANFLSSDIFNIGVFIMETPVSNQNSDAENVHAFMRALNMAEEIKANR